LGGAKNFCSNFPKLARKNAKKNELQKNKKRKKRLHFISRWAHFFKSKHFKNHFAQIFPKLAQTSSNLPENNHTIKRPRKKKKNVCTLILGAISVKAKHIQRFCEGFHTFCPSFHRFFPDLKRFFRIFTKSKVLG